MLRPRKIAAEEEDGRVRKCGGVRKWWEAIGSAGAPGGLEVIGGAEILGGDRKRLEMIKTMELKNLAGFANDYIFALLSRKKREDRRETVYANAALVNRLRRLPFTEE